jgi:uncharacterized protein GlcG (DUF336 family)
MKILHFFPRAVLLSLLVLSVAGLFTLVAPVKAEQTSPQDNTQVIQAFASQEQSGTKSIEDQTKHVVMFAMGVPLLVLLLITGGLGIAMGVYGKQVFVAHMVCAGLSMTLAIAHAIVGLVWFYPF